MVLRNITKEDAGSYICVIFELSTHTMEKTNTIKIDVQFKPYCRSDQPVVYFLNESTPTDVVCDIFANPNPNQEFHWQVDIAQDTKYVDYQILADERLDGRKYGLRSTARITLEPMEIFDGNYDVGEGSCWTANEFGQNEPCKFLFKIEKPSEEEDEESASDALVEIANSLEGLADRIRQIQHEFTDK